VKPASLPGGSASEFRNRGSFPRRAKKTPGCRPQPRFRPSPSFEMCEVYP
jgi:hypothetical protein